MLLVSNQIPHIGTTDYFTVYLHDGIIRLIGNLISFDVHNPSIIWKSLIGYDIVAQFEIVDSRNLSSPKLFYSGYGSICGKIIECKLT